MRQDFFAAALPPLRPAALCCACVPPCELLPLPLWLALPPFLLASGELAMRAARDFDIPLSFSASYCFSFFTFAGMLTSSECALLTAYPTPRDGIETVSG